MRSVASVTSRIAVAAAVAALSAGCAPDPGVAREPAGREAATVTLTAEAHRDLVLARAALERENRCLRDRVQALEGDSDILIRVIRIPKIDAKVFSVDPDGGARVWLSAGRNNSLDNGMCLTVYRRDEFVAKVEVTGADDWLSLARVIFVAPGKCIEEGDDATTRLD